MIAMKRMYGTGSLKWSKIFDVVLSAVRTIDCLGDRDSALRRDKLDTKMQGLKRRGLGASVRQLNQGDGSRSNGREEIQTVLNSSRVETESCNSP